MAFNLIVLIDKFPLAGAYISRLRKNAGIITLSLLDTVSVCATDGDNLQ